jgi:hypothetical protein
VVHSFFALLPASPIYIPSSTVTAITPILHIAAWWFPVTGMLAFLGLYLVAVGVLIVVLLTKQFIEAIIP